jgi:hypothetical protein
MRYLESAEARRAPVASSSSCTRVMFLSILSRGFGDALARI